MNSVGIDISKGRSTVAVMRPFGEVVISPFEVRHTDSELSKLATRYGVIRDGRMVQEITAQELEENCRDYLHVRVDKPKEAAVCLEQGLGITHYEARPEGQLLIYDSCESDQVSRTLTGNGIVVRELYLHRRDLEEYFVEMMGGGENA